MPSALFYARRDPKMGNFMWAVIEETIEEFKSVGLVPGSEHGYYTLSPHYGEPIATLQVTEIRGIPYYEWQIKKRNGDLVNGRTRSSNLFCKFFGRAMKEWL
jgi:hypothetical protein